VHLCLRLQVSRLVVRGSVVDAGVLDEASASSLQRMAFMYGGSGDKASRIYNFLATADSLTHLSFTDFCNNSMLQVIGSTCANLSCLELSASIAVTDEGILRLCGLSRDVRQNIGVLSQGGQLQPHSKCLYSLRRIKIDMTAISDAGVAIMLLVLPNLEYLHVDFQLTDFFSFMRELNIKYMQRNLLELNSSKFLKSSHLSILTELYPNLEHIELSFAGNLENDLLNLSHLTSLINLKFLKFENVNIEAFVLILEKIGHQIIDLHLSASASYMLGEPMPITRRNLQSLAKSCRNLATLSIDGYSMQADEPEQTPSENVYFFNTLTNVTLINISISAYDLYIFFAHCRHVQEINLTSGKHNVVINDEFINTMLDLDNFQRLVKMRVSHAQITYKTVLRLVAECPLLEEIGKLSTWLTSMEQVKELRASTKNNNLILGVY